MAASVRLVRAAAALIYSVTARCCGESNGTSQSQQSLQQRHFEHRWLSQVSLVQQAQILSDSCSQMLQAKVALPFIDTPIVF